MIQSYINQNARHALTDVILLAKARKDLSFAQIAEGTGLHEAFVTAALLGQHPLPADAAHVVADTLGLDADAVLVLQSIPLRGSIGNGIPTDPTIYRFYEMIQVYGTTLKACLNEACRSGPSTSDTSRPISAEEGPPLASSTPFVSTTNT